MDQPVPEIASEELTIADPAEPAEATPKATKPKPQKRRRRRPVCSPNGLCHRRSYESFALYFPKVLKSVQKGMSLSHQAASVLDSFVEDLFDRIAREAAQLTHANNRVTISCQDFQAAVRILLPGELARNAQMEGTKALIRYTTRK